MSVAKTGRDDGNCGADQQRRPPPGDLPRRRGRHHGRRGGRQRQRQRQRARPGDLQRGHHRLGPGRHRRQVRAASAATAATRGARTTRTTRSPTSATTAATSTSSRRASASGRRCPAPATATRRARRWPPRPSPAPSRSTRRAARTATPAEVRDALRYLGNLSWKTSTDPDDPRAAARRAAAWRPSGRSRRRTDCGVRRPTEPGASIAIPVTVTRSSTFFERVRLSVSDVPAGWTAALADDEPARLDGQEHDGHDQRPATAKAGTLPAHGRRHQLGSDERIDDHGPGRCDAVPTSRTSIPDRVAVPVRRHGRRRARPCSAPRARSPAPRWPCSWTARWTCDGDGRRLRRRRGKTGEAASTPWPRPGSPAAAARAASARPPSVTAPRCDVPRSRAGPAQRHDRYVDDDDRDRRRSASTRFASVGHHRRLWPTPRTARRARSRASRWPPSVPRPRARAASTDGARPAHATLRARAATRSA